VVLRMTDPNAVNRTIMLQTCSVFMRR